MPILVQCPRCSMQFSAADPLAGSVVTCSCGQALRVPMNLASAPPLPTPAAPPMPQRPVYSPPANSPAAYAPPAYPPPGQPPRPSARSYPSQSSGYASPRPAVSKPRAATSRGGSGKPRSSAALVIAFILGGVSVLGVLGFMFVVLIVMAVGGSSTVSADGPLSSGTGFVIHQSGYVLTNHHVIEGPGELYVRLSYLNDMVPAEVVAQDSASDMALLRLRLQQGSKMRTMTVAPGQVRRGARVAAFGYPLGDILGRELKLTTGVISSLPEISSGNMLLLDCRVNPGNSGGPLCNSRGEVVGMVTAKSTTDYGLDSYGMAIPADTLDRFLRSHCPGYGITNSPPLSDASNSDWDVVDRLVSPCVVMVLKM